MFQISYNFDSFHMQLIDNTLNFQTAPLQKSGEKFIIFVVLFIIIKRIQ